MEKATKKVQYEIDQISQKHNEEIAKIQKLKELSSSRRSERVVYSNLFKKLEKEIKHYEDIYKEHLIKCEAVKIRQTQITEDNPSGQSNQDEIVSTEHKTPIAEEESPFIASFKNSSDGWNFITSKDDQNIKIEQLQPFENIEVLLLNSYTIIGRRNFLIYFLAFFLDFGKVVNKNFKRTYLVRLPFIDAL